MSYESREQQKEERLPGTSDGIWNIIESYER